MLRLDITDVENNETITRYGSERELYAFIDSKFPQAYSSFDLKTAIDALNNSDLYRAKVEPWEPRKEPLLRPDYLTWEDPDFADARPRHIADPDEKTSR